MPSNFDMPTNFDMRSAVVATGLLLVLAGCGSSSPEPGPVFDNEGGAAITCMKHQPASPGARYTDPAMKNTAEVLNGLLRYYTANGRKPYCDRAPATEIDKQWARLYVTEGAARSQVAPILDS
ncbi:MAG TPA: hypothetical protein VGJ13_10675 [Pseudonocardiaceae bacterium]|jgi:hypothetical protein